MWEYDCRLVPSTPESIRDTLNELDADGWEVVHMQYMNHPFVQITLKRRHGAGGLADKSIFLGR